MLSRIGDGNNNAAPTYNLTDRHTVNTAGTHDPMIPEIPYAVRGIPPAIP